MSESISVAELSDPTTTSDYRMCLYVNGALMSQAIVLPSGVCDGEPCWEARPTGFNYGDKSGLRGGVTSIRVRASDEDRASAKLKGAGSHLYQVTLPFTAPVVAELHNAETGACFTITYGAADIVTNSWVKGKFRAAHK
jgi:hypothetical protein